LTGQFYRQFAVTIAAAMIISAINAQTLTPSRAVAIFRAEERAPESRRHEALPWWIFGVGGGVLAVWLGQKFLGGAEGTSTGQRWAVRIGTFAAGALVVGLIGWFIIRPVNGGLAWIFARFNRFFDRITALYGWGIGKLVRVSVIVLLVYGGLLVLTYWRVATAPTGFIPDQDQGYLLVNVQLPDSASVQRTQEVMAQIDQMARRIPGVAHTVAIAGESFLLSMNASNLGSMFVVLEPFEERRSHDRYDLAIAQTLRQQAAREIEGAVVGVFRSPPIRGLGNAGGFQLQTEQHGYVNLDELQAKTDELVRQANMDPKFNGVFTLFRAHTPQLFVDIDRTKAESLQVPIKDVFTTLQVFMGGMFVNQFNRFGRTWQVQVQAAPRERTNRDIVNRLYVRNAQGQMVPLGTLASVKDSTGPLMVTRYNMYTSAAVNGNAAPGVSSGDAIRAMQRLAQQLDVPFEWTQLTFLQVQAGNVALLIFALGTLLVYLVLAAKYESWKLPLAVILVVPLCMLASVTGMVLAALPVDIFVQIGLLVLVGLASKNAILIVEYARDLHEQGKDIHQATVEASKIRLRPIIMTSLAFIFGVMPLIVATGAGAEMRRSLGIAVFSGMIGVTLFGLFLTPVFYYALMWLGEGRKGPSRSGRSSLLRRT
jgi:multidrug efflux pump